MSFSFLIIPFLALFALADDDVASVSRGQGLVFQHEQTELEMRLRFRLQSRFTYDDYDQGTPEPDTTDFAIRRARLRFDGHVMDPRLLYKIQLSFTRGDMDFDTTNYPNILRDAAIAWRLSPKIIFWGGQMKLPGNRQRVISSGEQEFVDRSLLNSTFNLDRDLGVQSYFQFFDSAPLWLKLAISNGQGRSNVNRDTSLSYTARVEWLPFGEFKDGGDYYEGDLAYENDLKVSVGATLNFNRKTNRVGGQIGRVLENDQTRDLTTQLADMLLKYRGWSMSAEYAHRDAASPIVTPNQVIYKGKAINLQLTHTFANRWAPGVRFTQLWPANEILFLENDRAQYTVGLTKYFDDHRIKLMGDVTHEIATNAFSHVSQSNWMVRLQLELGI